MRRLCVRIAALALGPLMLVSLRYAYAQDRGAKPASKEHAASQPTSREAPTTRPAGAEPPTSRPASSRPARSPVRFMRASDLPPSKRPASRPADDPTPTSRAGESHPDPKTPPASRPQTDAGGAPGATTTEPRGALELPQPLSSRDVQRLRLLEMAFDAENPKLRIRFSRPRNAPQLQDAVLDELRSRGPVKHEVQRVLEDGKPLQQLQAIIEATGLKYADRITIQDDTRLFREFREDVLPRVTTGCARAGCHGGESARVFRIPTTSLDRDGNAYAAFLVLDALVADGAPLLNRNDPGRSVLLDYLLPPASGRRQHASLRRNEQIKPLFDTEQMRDFLKIRDFIAHLKSPHPDYELEFKYPAWLSPPKRVEPPVAPSAPSH